MPRILGARLGHDDVIALIDCALLEPVPSLPTPARAAWTPAAESRRGLSSEVTNPRQFSLRVGPHDERRFSKNHTDPN